MDNRYSRDAFETTLRQMGINPENLGKSSGKKLPPLPASDPESLRRNAYSPFYGYRAAEFWGDAEVNSDEPKAFVKCTHYLVEKEDKVECRNCHVGWTLPPAWSVQNGKLLGKNEFSFLLI